MLGCRGTIWSFSAERQRSSSCLTYSDMCSLTINSSTRAKKRTPTMLCQWVTHGSDFATTPRPHQGKHNKALSRGSCFWTRWFVALTALRVTQQSTEMAAPRVVGVGGGAIASYRSCSAVMWIFFRVWLTLAYRHSSLYLIPDRGHYLHPWSRLRELNHLLLPLCRLIIFASFLSGSLRFKLWTTADLWVMNVHWIRMARLLNESLGTP